MKEGIGLRQKIVDGDCYYNLTSICCVYKENFFKNDTYRRTLRPYKFRKLQYSTQIVKTQFNSKQIIQTLQPIIIDNSSTHSYIVDIS